MMRIKVKESVVIYNIFSQVSIITEYNDGSWVAMDYDYIVDLTCTRNSSGYTSGYHTPDIITRRYVGKKYHEWIAKEK